MTFFRLQRKGHQFGAKRWDPGHGTPPQRGVKPQNHFLVLRLFWPQQLFPTGLPTRRTLPLIPEMEDYLRRLRQVQRENQILMGPGYVRNDFVCKWPDGTPFRPDVVSRGFRRLLKRHGLPDIRFHDLRHSCASLLLAKGFQLKEISEWLGHSDIGTNGNIYGHLEYQSEKRLADGMGELLHMKSVSGDK